MKINKQKLPSHIGDIVVVEDASIPNGTYQIIEAAKEFQIFYDIPNHQVLYGDIGDVEVTIITTPVNERLELLYEGILKVIFEILSTDAPDKMDAVAPWQWKALVLKKLIGETL